MGQQVFYAMEGNILLLLLFLYLMLFKLIFNRHRFMHEVKENS